MANPKKFLLIIALKKSKVNVYSYVKSEGKSTLEKKLKKFEKSTCILF